VLVLAVVVVVASAAATAPGGGSSGAGIIFLPLSVCSFVDGVVCMLWGLWLLVGCVGL
jgi:hypothetical protein